MAESYGDFMSSSLRNLQIVPAVASQYHEQWMRVPISLHPCQHLLFSSFLKNNKLANGLEVVTNCDFDLHFSNDFDLHFSND